ncbi:formin-like protein 7 [Ananas comosus]|uniref:Formin-like protein 7 n=1 Tax=Ananas comosus TaxID=4615 RepID=A0A6P5FCT7_ANACO|nr:formin-like protein 7 [Ananas comosus]XP_020091212.1 formin-like protein 7 [Ananas comosus]XP_020091213.1 formin-like protein 7 [Ananas comosus]
MKVPRVESKLRVLSFMIQFRSQVGELKNSLNAINSASEEVRSSVKLKRIMQTILSLGNALNQEKLGNDRCRSWVHHGSSFDFEAPF